MTDTNPSTTEGPVTFHVKSAGGQKWTLTLPLTTTSQELKAKLAGEEYANVPATSQRLILSGKVLKDDETLAQHNMKEGNTMHLVKSAASNQRQTPANSSSTISNAGTPQQTGVPQNLAAGTGNDPLAGLTGARFAGFHGLPSMEELRNPTPEDMIQRLQDPNFAQMMNEALQNPQLIEMMINQNPQLRSMAPQARQILSSPEFRQTLTDPQRMQQMMAMQRAMGINPFGGVAGLGGAGGQDAFPAPGVTNAAEQQQQQQQQQGQMPNQTTPADQQNPFAMFNNLYGGMRQPAAATTGAAAGAPQDPLTTNPFLALLNPAATTQAPAADGARDASNPATGQFPPSFVGMMNNPLFSQLMNNPEAARQTMESIFGPENSGLGGFGGFGGPPDNRPPEERYSTQLRQLNEMGFHNFDRNIQALSRSGGDVNGALEWLFSQPQ